MSDSLVNYLTSVRGLYPFGIPVGLIEAEKVAVKEASKTKKKNATISDKPLPSLLIIGDKLSDNGRELLIRALNDGLKLQEGQYRLILCSEVSPEVVRGEIDTFAGLCVLVFGTPESPLLSNLLKGELAPQGEWFNMYGRKAIRTLSPDQVSKDSSLKRAFWEQLKKIIPVISE